MANNNEVVQLIKERLRLSDVISPYVNLKSSGGGRFLGLCPFHNEKTPSFNVNDVDGYYKCFGCGKSGDVFSFLMEKENYSFLEALKILADKAGVVLNQTSHTLSPLEKKRNELYDLYTRVAASFADILLNKPEAKHARLYLASRNLTLDTIAEYQLGFVPEKGDWVWNFLKKKHYSDEFLQESGLFSKKGSHYCLFTGRLVFPVKNKAGQVVAFSGRFLRRLPFMNEDGPKYINSPETLVYQKRDLPFGYHLANNAIRREESVYIVEGNFDVVSMHQAGIHNVIAPLGTAFTEQQATLLGRYAKKFYCLFDSDGAGQNAAVKALFLLQKMHLPAYVIEIPSGKDPSDILKSEGPEGIKKIIKNPQNALDFLLKICILKYGVERFEQKQEIIQFIIPFVNMYESEVQKNEALRLIADKLSIDFISLQKDVVKLVKQPDISAASSIQTKKIIKKTILPQDELLLLVAASKDRTYFKEVKEQFQQDDFRSPYSKELFVALEDCYKQENFTVEEILTRLSDEDLRDQVEIWMRDVNFIQDAPQTLHDIIYRIRIERLEERKRELISLVTSQNIDHLDDNDINVVEEIQILNQEIKKFKGEI